MADFTDKTHPANSASFQAPLRLDMLTRAVSVRIGLALTAGLRHTRLNGWPLLTPGCRTGNDSRQSRGYYVDTFMTVGLIHVIHFPAESLTMRRTNLAESTPPRGAWPPCSYSGMLRNCQDRVEPSKPVV
jgi:hypothetical protein